MKNIYLQLHNGLKFHSKKAKKTKTEQKLTNYLGLRISSLVQPRTPRVKDISVNPIKASPTQQLIKHWSPI